MDSLALATAELVRVPVGEVDRERHPAQGSAQDSVVVMTPRGQQSDAKECQRHTGGKSQLLYQQL